MAYHTIHVGDFQLYPGLANDIAGIIATNSESYWVSQNFIPAIGNKWAYRLSAKDWTLLYGDTNPLAGAGLATMVVDALVNGVETPGLGRVVPQRVIIDELTGLLPDVPDEYDTGTRYTVYYAAIYLNALIPEYRGRWGCYLAHPPEGNVWGFNSPGVVDALNQLMTGGAFLVSEQYFGRGWYCLNGEQALINAIRGEAGAYPTEGLAWLVRHRDTHFASSGVKIHAVINVTDLPLGEGGGLTAGVKFLDRLIYVLKNRVSLPWLVAASNGGVGTWKWEHRLASPASEPNSGICCNNTNRDFYFRQSWNRYCGSGQGTPEYSQAEVCP